MKASVLTAYGSPDNFKLQEVPKPVPTEDEVLVKIHATAINSWDWEILKGKPFVNRMMTGLLRPTRMNIFGCDIAGRVEAVGSRVKKFFVGDDVYGDLSRCSWGGFAEYVCVPENADALALKPTNLTYIESAAVPQAAVLALQGLRQGKVEQAKTVLINGASGGVGPFAIALAKQHGVRITAVCAAHGMEFVRSLGIDEVIDFEQQDFTARGKKYDLILDIQGHHAIFDYLRALECGGRYVMVGGEK